MPGYNIECDQGSLYYRKCYVVLASGEKQEIIGYTAGGDPISKDSTDVPTGTAWVPTMTTLDMYGDAYQPYPEGIPYTAGGGSVVNWAPSGGADVANIYTYLNQSMPGAYARQMEKDRTCNPLWPTFGCRTYKNKGVPIGTTGGTTTATTGNADDETPSLWESFTSWWSGAAESFNALASVKPTRLVPQGSSGQPEGMGGSRRWIEHNGNMVATNFPRGVTPDNYTQHYADELGPCEWQCIANCNLTQQDKAKGRTDCTYCLDKSGVPYSGSSDFMRLNIVTPYAEITKNWLGRYKRQHYNGDPSSSGSGRKKITGSAFHNAGGSFGGSRDSTIFGGVSKSITADEMVSEIEGLSGPGPQGYGTGIVRSDNGTGRFKIPYTCQEQLSGWQPQFNPTKKDANGGVTDYILTHPLWIDASGDVTVNGQTYAQYKLSQARQPQRKEHKKEQSKGPEGAGWGQPLDAGGDSLGSNFGQDQGAQAMMAAESFNTLAPVKPHPWILSRLARGPEGADFGQPLDAGGDALGSNFGQDQGAQAQMAADEEMQVIEQDIPGHYIEPQTNVAWDRLAVPAIVLGGLGLALWQDKRMNRGAQDGRY